MAFQGISFELGSCIFTEFEQDEFLTAQPEGLGSVEAGSGPRLEPYELHHTYGFLSRPLDAETDPSGKVIQSRSCNLLIGSDGNDNHAWLAGDPRPIELLPKIEKGESMQYGPAANFARCKADGTVTLFTTTDGTYDGNSVYCQVAQDGFRAITPWGKVDMTANGFHMLHASGARIDAGAIGGLGAPLDALGSYVSLSAQMLKLEGALLALGTTTGAAEPAAKATSLQTVLGSVASALSAINAAITTMVAGGSSVTSPNLAAATTAIDAASTAVSAGAATIPSASTSVT